MGAEKWNGEGGIERKGKEHKVRVEGEEETPEEGLKKAEE